MTVQVDGLNVPPAIDLDGTAGGAGGVSVFYPDTAGRVALAPTAIVSDVEGDDLLDVTVTIAGFVQGADEEIIFGDVTVLPGVALATPVTVGAYTFALTYDGLDTIVIADAAAAPMANAQVEALLRSVTYDNTAVLDIAGNRTLAFVTRDADGTSLAAVATVDVEGSNAAPVAADDGTAAAPHLSGTEEVALAIDPAALLANDTDPEGDAISVVGYSNEQGGQIVIDATGAVTFVPDANHAGTATFDYTVADTFGATDTATVTLDFANVNDAPVLELVPGDPAAVPNATHTEGAGATPVVPAGAVLSDVDDTDLEAAAITFTAAPGDRLVVGALPPGVTATASPPALLTSGATGGPVSLTLLGTAPVADYLAALQAIGFETASDQPDTAARTFEIVVSDGSLPSAPVQSTIDVVATNDAPFATNDGPFAVLEDGELSLPVATLLANDGDPDGTAPAFAGIVDVTGGAAIERNGTVVFTPTPDFSGAATITYAVSDGVAADVTAVVAIDVVPVNDAPVLDADGTTPAVETEVAAAFTEDGPAVALFGADFAVSDIDDTALEVAVVTLTNGAPGDLLAAAPAPAGAAMTLSPAGPLSTAGAQTLTLVGTVATAELEAWLRSVTFANVSAAPSEAERVVTVQVADGSLPSNIVSARVSVTAVNDAPVANPDPTLQVLEDDVLAVSGAALVANDTDPDGETPVLDSVGNAVGGTVALDGTGTVTFTPDADTFGPASFDYTIRDAAGETATQTVAVDVIAVNDAPTIAHAASPNPHVVLYTEGDPAVPLVDGFTVADIDSAQLAAVEVQILNARAGDVIEAGAAVPGITVSAPGPLAADGSIFVTITGPADAASFQAAVAGLTFRSTTDAPSTAPRDVAIRASDGALTSTTLAVRIDVAEVNDLPDVPTLAPFATVEDVAITIPFAELTGALTDRDGDPLTVSALGPVTGGTTAFVPGGVVFTPAPDRDTAASFEYTISDGRGGEVVNTANVSITPVDDTPVVDIASGTAGPFVEDGAPVPLLDPALTVSDVDSAVLDAALVQIGGQAGDLVTTAALPAGIAVTIEPAVALTAPGTIVVTITGAASADAYADALRALRFQSVSQSPDETPRAIQLAVIDASTTSAIVDSTLTVQAVNDVPVSAGLALDTEEDTPLAVAEATLVASGTDADGDALTLAGTANVTGGTLATGANGALVFTPTADFIGAAGFDYTLADGNGGSVTARADIAVAAVDDAPTLDLSAAAPGIDYAFTYVEDDGATPIVGADIAVADVDTAMLAGATITLTNGQAGDMLNIATLPRDISASVVPPGALSAPGTITIYLTGAEIPSVYGFALEAISFETASQAPVETPRVIEVSVNDGTSSSTVARTQIAVVSVNDAPVAADDGVAPLILAAEDGFVDFVPVANDSDAEGDPLAVIAVAGTPVAAGGSVAVPEGRVTLLADGQTLRFEPRANFFGSVGFPYTVSDGAASDVATVAIEVTPVNDAPVLGPDAPVSMLEDVAASFDPTLNDTDADGDPLTVSGLAGRAAGPGVAVTLPEGEVRVGIDGRTVTFTPAPNWNGTIAVPYTVTDGNGATVAAELVFDVAPVNDPLLVLATPPAVTFADGAAVSLPMDSFLDDPDGDPITYSVAGLPAGLAIDPATGLIAGTLGSEASDRSPYSVVVTGDDGMGSRLDIAFQMSVVNIAPVSLGDASVPVGDGDIVSFPTAPLFDDADGDALAFSAMGLPAWLRIDAATGEVSGVAPFDASQSGAVNVRVSAVDHAGAAAEATVTFVPTNPAPAVVRPIAPLFADEGQNVSFDLGAHIADGGNDGDALTWTVSGLPTGVFFDPATLRVFGTPDAGTRSLEAYRVDVAVDDGQGGTLATSFPFYVGDVSTVRDEFDFDSLPDAGGAASRERVSTGDGDDATGGAGLPNESGIVGAAVSGIADTASISDGTQTKDRFAARIRAVLRDEVEPSRAGGAAIEPLHVERPITYVEGPDGSITSFTGSNAYAAPAQPAVVELSDAALADAVRADSERPIRVAARVAPGRVFVDARDPAVSGDPVRPVTFALRGEAGEITQKIVRNGLASFGVPAGLATLSLSVAVELADDLLAVRDVDVDARTGEVSVLSGDGAPATDGRESRELAKARDPSLL